MTQNNKTKPLGARNDFEATALLKEKTTKHDQEITSLKTRLVALERRVGNNETFARSFSDSLKSQTVASEALTDSFNSLIDTNSNTRAALRRFVRSDHFHNTLAFLKSFGGAFFWVIVGALVTFFIPRIFGGD